MPWTEASTGRWERHPDLAEEAFLAFATATADLGRGHFDAITTIKLNITTVPDTVDIESALRHAWKHLRFKKPHLASTVEDGKFVYQVPDDSALEEWLQETFLVSAASNAEELYQTFNTTIKRPVLFYIPKSSELMLRADHCRIDGVGNMLI